MSSDSVEIQNLLSDQDYDQSLTKYTNSQFEYVSDYNNGSYNSSIFFDTTSSMQNKWICLADTWLEVPLQITSSGTAYDASALVAFKQSILNFITGMTISTSSGQTLSVETNNSIINNIRLLIEHDRSWAESEGPGLQFARDEVTPSPTMTGPYQSLGGVVQPSPQYAINYGFFKRCIQFKSQAVSVTGVTTLGCLLRIPLKYVSDLVRQMDFPQLNTRLQFNIQYAQSGGPLVPFTADQTGGDITPSPTWSIGAVSGISTCRLYYKSVSFEPSLNAKLLQKLQSGYTKTVFFRICDTYVPTGGDINSTASINKLVSPSTVHPLRLWLVGVPTTGYSGATVLPTFSAQFTNANVLVNNTNYYNNNLVLAADFYEVLREQFPGHGSAAEGGLVSFTDYFNGYALHCFDLSRVASRLSAPNESVSLQLVASRTGATSGVGCDIYTLVERLQAVKFQFTSAQTSVVVGLTSSS